MADKSGIEWTDATWNPVVGCSIVSPGCTNCYAMKMAARIERMHARSHYAGTTQPSKAGAVWTGKIALAPEHILTLPLRWKRPRRIFVNSMGDLFHENVTDAMLDRIFAVMALAEQHVFMILTKRSARMKSYFLSLSDERQEDAQDSLPLTDRQAYDLVKVARNLPPSNIWLGVSVEDKQSADERRDDLGALAAHGWTTFCSYEPALGTVDWAGWKFLRWLIVGGESGPNARPMHPDWARSARDWCATAGVAYFHKQNGEWLPEGFDGQHLGPSLYWAFWRGDHWDRDASGGELGQWMARVGKTRAGRLLDGRTHDAMPSVRP